MKTWESEPRECDKGVNSAQPPGPPFPVWGPCPARPTLGSQVPRFSSRREKREGERQGWACLLLPLLPSAGPFPSRQETSTDSQPAAALPPPLLRPPRVYRVTHPWAAGRALRLRPGCSALAPAGRARPGAAPAPKAPPPGLAPHSPTRAPGGVAFGGPDKGLLHLVH